MPKAKSRRGNTPLPQTLVIQNPPYAVAKNPEEPRPAAAPDSSALVKAAPEPPHYY